MTQPDTQHPQHDDQTEDQRHTQEDAATATSDDAVAADPSAARIAELEAQLADMKDRALRAMAETDNIRKRSEKERQDMAKFAVSGFARDLLGVSDNLRRALDAITPEQQAENEALKNIFTGVEATERELLRVFAANGIEKLQPMDVPFDPNFHEVMFEAPAGDKPAGTVIQLIEAGYTIHGRLLRPARVGVAKGEHKPQLDQEV